MRESASRSSTRCTETRSKADVLESVELYKSAACDGVIGLGGGSAIDVAKAVVVKARHDGPLAELEAQAGGMDRMTGPYDPIIAVPTTAGTGSEVGRSSVITSHELGRKIIIFSPWLMPKRARPGSPGPAERFRDLRGSRCRP